MTCGSNEHWSKLKVQRKIQNRGKHRPLIKLEVGSCAVKKWAFPVDRSHSPFALCRYRKYENICGQLGDLLWSKNKNEKSKSTWDPMEECFCWQGCCIDHTTWKVDFSRNFWYSCFINLFASSLKLFICRACKACPCVPK